MAPEDGYEPYRPSSGPEKRVVDFLREFGDGDVYAWDDHDPTSLKLASADIDEALMLLHKRLSEIAELAGDALQWADAGDWCTALQKIVNVAIPQSAGPAIVDTEGL